MTYCRFEYNGSSQFGWIETIAGHEQITRTLTFPPDKNAPESGAKKIPHIPLDEATLLAPVEPSKIVCVGRNYREHAAELGHEVPAEPLIFLKPPSAIIGPGQIIVRPKISARVDHEGELGVVIGKTCRNLKVDEDVRPYILGYTCVNDVTASGELNENPDFAQWCRSKGHDTFGCIGPVIATELDWLQARVITRLDGVERQNYPLTDMIMAPVQLVSLLSRDMSLLPGDVIACGTSLGVGSMKDGCIVEVEI